MEMNGGVLWGGRHGIIGADICLIVRICIGALYTPNRVGHIISVQTSFISALYSNAVLHTAVLIVKAHAADYNHSTIEWIPQLVPLFTGRVSEYYTFIESRAESRGILRWWHVPALASKYSNVPCAWLNSMPDMMWSNVIR